MPHAAHAHVPPSWQQGCHATTKLNTAVHHVCHVIVRISTQCYLHHHSNTTEAMKISINARLQNICYMERHVTHMHGFSLSTQHTCREVMACHT